MTHGRGPSRQPRQPSASTREPSCILLARSTCLPSPGSTRQPCLRARYSPDRITPRSTGNGWYGQGNVQTHGRPGTSIPRDKRLGRRRGRLRRQGHQRHRRDPVGQRGPRMRARIVVVITALALVLSACSSGSSPSPSAVASVAGAAPASLTVYGASSLKAVLARAQVAYQAANPGTTITISTDSSSALETKIEQGAPADVFLSADTANPQKLVDQGLAAGALTTFAGNLLTVIVPTANPAAIQTPADLARAGIKIITCGDTVPIARYAAQLVANLARQPGYSADFVAKYTANIASKEDSVAAVVSKIELGEGDAGVVYVTDAKTSTKVTAIAVPNGANVSATYSGVVVKVSANVAAAQAFLTWFAGPSGQAILASFGFLPPS